MATTTNFEGGSFGRKFSISRENGTENKEGVPHFFEWVKEIPQEKGNRKFETRKGKDGNFRNYELFRAIDGHLIDIEVQTKDFSGKPEEWLVLKLADGEEDYQIELGQIDGRYSMDTMKRLLDPAFNPNQKVRLSPYALKNDSGSWNIGVSIMNGTDTKLSAKRESEWLTDIPEATKIVFKGETQYDFTPIANWLIQKVGKKVLPKLKKDPISAPSNAKDVDFPQDVPPTGSADGDDLPF